MKRKFILRLLASIMAIGLPLIGMPANVYADDNVSTTIGAMQNVQKGDEIYGFKVLSIVHDDAADADKIMVEHEKTGAKMAIIKNASPERGFCVQFNTPTQNDKGINHILEHSILGGSEKYPSNNLIFDVSNNTYSSFVNALTGQNTTMFPVCSKSEDQLMKLTDIYLDSVYHPLIANDKRVFDREAWHYSLDDKDAPLSISGIVYNEMKTNYSSEDKTSLVNAKRTLLKDTNQRYNSGGVPDDIPTLSYDEFLKTYKKNYVPSNSFMILYGDVDYAKFLKMIDENYLSKYDKTEVLNDRQIQGEYENKIDENYDFPISSKSNDMGSIIDVTFGLDDSRKMDREDLCAMIVLAQLLDNETSEFKKALRQSGVATDYKVSMVLETNQPFIRVTAKNADASKKDEFYNLVMDELKKISNKGIDRNLAKSSLKASKFSTKASDEKGAFIQIYLASIYNALFGDPTIDPDSYDDDMIKKTDNGYFESIINNYLVNNKRTAVVCTNPKKGLLEEKDKALNDMLQKKKSSMSKEEIDALVKYTNDFKKWTEAKENQKVIDSMKGMDVKDLPVEQKDYNVNETTADSVKLITADTNKKDLLYSKLVFDESHLTADELHYLEFYCDMIQNNVPTSENDGADIQSKLAENSYGYNVSMDAVNDDKNGEKAHPVFTVKSEMLKDDIADNLKLYSDILTKSKIDKDADYIKNTINQQKQGFQNICEIPYYYMNKRAMARNNMYYRIANYYDGIDYNNFIQKLDKEYTQNPQAVAEKLLNVRNKAFSKNDLTVLLAADKDSKDEFIKDLPCFTDNIQNDVHQKADLNLPIPDKREALEINSNVQYLSVNSNMKNAGQEENGFHKVMQKLLNQEYLIHEIRLKSGAYTTESDLDRGQAVSYTARDGNYYNSLNTILKSGDFLKNNLSSITQDKLDGIIISTFAANDSASGELSNAQTVLQNYLNGITQEDTKKNLTEIKNTNLNDLQNCPQFVDNLAKNANYIVAASHDKIEEHKDMFDKVIKLQ